ncbi:MAG: hypothetical protein JNN15_02910 [Blastocatellia bacterium]|nr:hypothetical protein [Blastocatellia bacterium]
MYEKLLNKRLLEKGEKQRKRESRLSISEIMVLMVWFHQSGYRTFKDYYRKEVFNIDRFRNQLENISSLATGDRLSLLWNFFFSAERYEKNGQNDIAALLYYRTFIFEHTFRIYPAIFAPRERRGGFGDHRP